MATESRVNAEQPAEGEPSDRTRRGFLKQAALGSAAALAASGAVVAREGSGDLAAQQPSAAEMPPQSTGVAEGAVANVSGGVPASDYMVDLLRSLSIEHVAFLPGDTFRGLHESVINHGMVTSPRMGFIPCMHEEMSVAV